MRNTATVESLCLHRAARAVDDARNERDAVAKILDLKRVADELDLSFADVFSRVALNPRPELRLGEPVNLETVRLLRDRHLDAIEIKRHPFLADLLDRLKRGKAATPSDIQGVEDIRARIRLGAMV